MKKIAVFADVHLNPGDSFECDFSGYEEVISDGDFLNILPWGMEAWRKDEGKYTIESIVKCLPFKGTTLIARNHEGRKSWVEELFKNCNCEKVVKVVDQYEIPSNDRLYRFKHGGDYSDWRLWSRVADEGVGFLTRFSVTRNLLYRICRRMGYMPPQNSEPRTVILTLNNPHKKKKGIRSSKNPKKYKKWTAALWALALKEVHSQHKSNMSYKTLVIGHTHLSCHIKTGFECELINLGKGELRELVIP